MYVGSGIGPSGRASGKAYFIQYGRFVASLVSPGARSRSAAVVSYLKVDDKPINAISANYHPTELMVFWDGMLNIGAQQSHLIVADAIGRLSSGLIVVNAVQPPDAVPIPFKFAGTVATVDADRIARTHLKLDPPPVGLTMMGALTSGVVADRFRQERVCALAQAIAAGAALPLLWAVPGLAISSALGGVFTGMQSVGRTSFMSMLTRLSVRSRGATMGLQAATNSSAAALGAGGGGLALAVGGYSAVGLFCCAAALTAVAIYARRVAVPAVDGL